MPDPVGVPEKSPRIAWNNRGQAASLIETRLVTTNAAPAQRANAAFNLAIDSKLRGCDVMAIKVEDVAPHGYAVDRATLRQRRTGRPVRFELTEQTRQAIDDYIRVANKKSSEHLFVGR
jgi:hypothetical protein